VARDSLVVAFQRAPENPVAQLEIKLAIVLA
jgi:hypothetical protein